MTETMNRTFLPLFLIILLILSSCKSNRFDYQSAYKFSTYKYQHHEKASSADPTPWEGEPVASLKPGLLSSGQEFSIEPALLEKANRWKDLSRSEKKELRKEVRKIVKTSKKEIRKARKDLKHYETHRITNTKLYAGIVIGSGGLLLLILNVATFFGGLLVLIGVILIVWAFLELGGAL